MKSLIAALVLSLWACHPAAAHFLFVKIAPPAEGGRFAEVYFSDQADAGDARFIDKVASTKLWVQTKPGQFDALPVHKGTDRLRAVLPPTPDLAVIGQLTYGVLGRAKQPAFLLRHYPKAVAGDPKIIAGLQTKPEIPLEIQCRPGLDEVELVALRQGKPIAGAVFNTVGLDLKGEKLTADAEGKVRWKPPTRGYFAVYISQTLKEAGEHDGKKYDEIREFATLSFAWPLKPQGPDEEAVALFQEAIAARSSWTKFPGFSAAIVARVQGRSWKGNATLYATGDVEIDSDDETVAPWVKEQLESMVIHRLARPQTKTPVLRFADSDVHHPLGRLLIFEGGQFASSYRVKDRQIMVVNRLMGKSNMTITMLENERSADGQFLPRSYTVQYWDAATGQLKRADTIQDRWTRVASWDLPAEHTSMTSVSGGFELRTMTLSGHKILPASK